MRVTLDLLWICPSNSSTQILEHLATKDTHLEVKPLVMVLTVDVRIQDQIIFVITHLKEYVVE